jgi:hypothetical protein
MKKLILLFLLALGSSVSFKSQAQVSVNINIGSQPQWGPVGYDYVDYYYLPDIESYYYVPKRQFIYMGTGGWVFTTSLPPRYRGYDLYSGYKVVINSPQPYRYFTTHKVKYAKFKGNHGQSVIAKSKNKKYVVGNSRAYQGSKSVSYQKAKPMKVQHINKGNGKGHGQGNGKGKH